MTETKTKIEPFPMSAATREFVERVYAQAKTMSAEDVVCGASKLVTDGANPLERSLPILAYSAGGGSVVKLIQYARDHRSDPNTKPLLDALKNERLPNDGGERRDENLIACLDYQGEVFIERQLAKNEQLSYSARAKRERVEKLLGRPMTAEERTAFGDPIDPNEPALGAATP